MWNDVEALRKYIKQLKYLTEEELEHEIKAIEKEARKIRTF